MIGVVVSLKEVSWEEFLRIKSFNTPLHKLSVVTASMEPLIPVGATVVVDKMQTYKTYDIIVFWQNKKLIVHVLWNINREIRYKGKEVLVTRSLNSRILDTSITPDNVLGKVVNYKLSFWDLLKLYFHKRSKKF